MYYCKLEEREFLLYNCRNLKELCCIVMWKAEFVSDVLGYLMRFPNKVLNMWPGLLAAYSKM